jgi:hypothetical protein
LCPIRVVAHRVFELRLGGWAGWQIQVVGAAGYNTSIFTRPAGAALNFIRYQRSLCRFGRVLGQNGPWVGKYQSRVDELQGIAHTVIGVSLPRLVCSHVSMQLNHIHNLLYLNREFLSSTRVNTE